MPSKIPGVAGPATFQRRLERGLSELGVSITYGLHDDALDAILVIGGTRALGGLARARRKGIRIFHRLNGMNWIHKRRRTGLRHYLRSEMNNLLLRWIRDRFANHVIYQSAFAQNWWEKTYGAARVNKSVIYNGVPLEIFKPNPALQPPSNPIQLLMVEGNLDSGYEVGLQMGVELANRLQSNLSQSVKLAVVGKISKELEAQCEKTSDVPIRWLGLVTPEKIPHLDQSAHIFYSGDPNPACPNAVIEALACGLPVVAFATGAIPEIITKNAGAAVEYGGDVWKLEKPDLEALAAAAANIFSKQALFREGARERAQEAFSLRSMVESYLRVFEEMA